MQLKIDFERDCTENRKRRQKNTKNNDWETIESSFWVFLSELHRGPLQPQNLMSKDCLRTHLKKTHKKQLRWHRKVTGGMGRVPDGTRKVFDNLNKLSCKLEKQENFRVKKKGEKRPFSRNTKVSCYRKPLRTKNISDIGPRHKKNHHSRFLFKI